ncbi:hypothetical protein FIBSPDRAFT_887794 [Athelia psychrophila]|uniref:Uncharacterized protein n=1 Tax=Athelia psychrophila TaxID=1759441 RepID=A0A166P899_9AGAM|nr:hypothetical protein FIBSPDRAFT_887794 [Fibularhizoctonia sp. CBS 109695]
MWLAMRPKSKSLTGSNINDIVIQLNTLCELFLTLTPFQTTVVTVNSHNAAVGLDPLVHVGHRYCEPPYDFPASESFEPPHPLRAALRNSEPSHPSATHKHLQVILHYSSATCVETLALRATYHSLFADLHFIPSWTALASGYPAPVSVGWNQSYAQIQEGLLKPPGTSSSHRMRWREIETRQRRRTLAGIADPLGHLSIPHPCIPSYAGTGIKLVISKGDSLVYQTASSEFETIKSAAISTVHLSDHFKRAHNLKDPIKCILNRSALYADHHA